MSKFWTKLLLTISVMMVLNGCAAGEKSDGKKTTNTGNNAEKSVSTEEQTEPQANAELKDVENKTVGTVSFFAQDNHVQIVANIDGLEPGHHGFHIHEKGICERDAKEGPFTTAGGHFNPDGKMHSEHAGDMPSLYVNEDGTASYSATFNRLTIDQLKKEKLAVIVHANPDNFGNIPDRYQTEGKTGPDEATMKAGDAGDRQACGVILSTDEDKK
ncbi:superoxide dismutase family protein [Bacillus sp. B-jedd]|uniref:superoxide dismutase family protein n=1 Tax=Bacillus sp. B-jedd TaxID=1476857 RepID=UPI00051557E0|nr:superoxide dismutase family protein [Bacillus sp. B-jedd]CEG28680.1 superoxide dismutase [Cu-Zn] [Bacillus sp. B-jedd]